VWHRELIVGFLSGTLFEKDLDPEEGDSVDIRATKACLKALYTSKEDTIVLPCAESGSTLRFMIPVALVYLGLADKSNTKKLEFTTAGRLIERPLDDLEKCLEPFGVKFTKITDENRIIVEGRLTAGDYVIDGSVSSQYISGLLMALSAIPDEVSTVLVTGNIASVHYINLTVAVLSKYGCYVERKDNVFIIPEERDNEELSGFVSKVEGDWSNGAFLLALGALLSDGSVKVKGLNPISVQGDRDIIEHLETLGIEYTRELSGDITVKGQVGKQKIETAVFDMTHTPDIAPYVSVLGMFFAKKTTLNGISRLRIKESDRAQAIKDDLEKAGAKVTAEEDKMVIESPDGNFPQEIKLSSYNDHRMAMTAILIAAGTGAVVDVDDIECLSKSYPAFIDVVKKEFAV